uniref:Methyltransferase small domain-containing protein n=1 Tax=Lotharella globosa TaxID=91324 RepID=A0A7S3ZCR7_9EUKA
MPDAKDKPKAKKIPLSLEDELKKCVKKSQSRIQQKYERQNVTWDVNNMDRSKRLQTFEYKTNAGTILRLKQGGEDVGGVVWTATIQFSKYLERRHEANCPCLKGLRVLELGCGTGMVGIIAGALGAKVTITDLPHVAKRAAENVEINKESVRKGGGSVKAAPFTWGDRKAEIVDVGEPAFDMILAAEVVYTKESADLFLDALDHVFSDKKISHESTELLLAGDQRGRVGRKALLKAAIEKYDVREIPSSEMDPKWISDNVQLHTIRPKSKASS